MAASGLGATSINGVKIYNLSSGKTLPQWISQKQKKSLSKDEEYRKRVELVQDFHFPTASQRIRMSDDGNYIVATGTYPPWVKVYDVRDLSMKFERGLDAEVVQFQVLSEDFGKLVFLQDNRTLAFHAPYGAHYSLRIPKFGRDMIYDQDTCDLIIGASGSDIYRMNLDQGQFLAPFESQCPAINVLKINPCHRLMGAGGDTGIVECWDLQTRTLAASLDVASILKNSCDVTALDFHSDGLTFAAGTSTGDCLLFDLRSSRPLLTKTHQYGLPILDIKFHEYSGKVISTDCKLIKIWDKKTGDIFTNVETPANIKDVCVVKAKGGVSSGVILATGEQQRIMSYYIPQLGYAPKWCSFLDGLTEELEEEAQSTVYDNFKFVTRAELETFGMQHMIGTPVLKAYMHGFFMDWRLYAKMKASVEPFAYDKWRKEQIQKKLQEKHANRITIQKRLPKVNRALAQKLLSKDDSLDKFSNPTGDDRFAKLFESKDFEVDVDSETYRKLHPNAAMGQMSKKNKGAETDSEDEVLADRFDLVQDADELEGRGSDVSTSDDDEDEEEEEKEQKRPVQFYQLGQHEKLDDLVGFGKEKDRKVQKEKRKLSKLPLAERLEQEHQKQAQRSAMACGGNEGAVREMSYIPQRSRRRNDSSKDSSTREKRGVQDLKLRKPWAGRGRR